MPEIVDDISYLSQEIGPRPAGTEEEQQAALYIADQIQKRTGFTAHVEDFATNVQPGIVEAICFGIPAIISLLAIIINALTLPAFFITLACAILYAFELMDKPLLSRAFENGVSQNVVARYTPGAKTNARNRKVVIVANYDSGKVQSELNGGLFGLYPKLVKASYIGLVALPVIWLLRTLFPVAASAIAVVFFNILTCVALLAVLVPVAVFFMHKAATYNEAANNNAAGVATMLEVARLIAEGSYSEEELAAMENENLHTAEEAYAAGVVPEGASLEYAAEPMGERERLASAKAAVAALTGKPVREYQVEHIDFTPLSDRDDIDTYEEMDYGEYGYREEDEAIYAAQESSSEYDPTAVMPRVEETADTSMPQLAYDAVPESASRYNYAQGGSSEPSWYTTGRAKAVKPEGAQDVPVKRSRYADALEVAMSESKEHFDEANRLLDEGTLDRIAQLQQEIESAATEDAASAELSLQEMFADAPASLKPEPKTEEGDQVATLDTDEKVATEESAFGEAAEVVPEPEIASDAVTREEVFAPAAEQESIVEADESEEVSLDQGETAQDSESASDDSETITENAPRQSRVVVPSVELETAWAIPPTDAPEPEPEPAPAPGLDVPEIANDDKGPGSTTAFAPIDVTALEDVPANKPAEDKPAETYDAGHDFSEIKARRPRTYRNLRVPGVSSSDSGPMGAPSRYAQKPEREDAGQSQRKQVVPEVVPARITAPTEPIGEPAPLVSERIPRIVVDDFGNARPATAAAQEQATPAQADRIVDNRRASLRNAIPSLSGEFAPVVVQAPAGEANQEVSKTGSFATGGLDSSFEPVGDELVADLRPDERYVEDADDSSFDAHTTETGAFTGPGYVEMPESRLGRFFSRFRKQEEADDTSASEWLDVDENFNPTEVGAARGSWESFRNNEDGSGSDSGVAEQTSMFDETDDESGGEDGRSWHGGAFSQLREKLSKITGGSEQEDEDEADEYDADAYEEYEDDNVQDDAEEPTDEEATDSSDKKTKSRKVVVRRNSQEVKEADDSEPEQEEDASVLQPDPAKEDDNIAEETRLIYSFRNPDINTEVWFVALGSEHAGNSGMKAFLAEHANDLRGSIVINLEGTGVGELSFIEEEGRVLTSRPSSRLKRYLRKASEITGITTGTARLTWRDSAASLAMKRGFQAMTIAGMEGNKPAFLGQGDDVLENIDEATVAENAQFILEVIKSI